MQPHGMGVTEPLRIGIDGYHMVQHVEMGASVFDRALARTIRNSGARLTGIFDIDVGGDPTIRDILFFDQLQRSSRRTPVRTSIGKILSDRASKASLVPVPLTTRVDIQSFAETLPQLDSILSAGNLFDRAFRHFDRTGRFLDVRTPEPIDVMHWSDAIPIRLNGAHNAYRVGDGDLSLGRRSAMDFATQADRLCFTSDARRRAFTKALSSPEIPMSVVDIGSADEDRAALSEFELRSLSGIFGLTPRRYVVVFCDAGLAEALQGVLSSSASMGDPIVIPERFGGHLSTPAGSAGRPRIRLPASDRHRRLLVRGAQLVIVCSTKDHGETDLLTAMAAGVPTMIAADAVLEEIAEGASETIRDGNPTALFAQMSALERDEARLATLGAGARARSLYFTEQACAERLGARHRDLVGRPR